MIIVGDTSGLVAAFNSADPQHRAARTAFRTASATVVSSLVFTELEHIITRSINRQAAHAASDWLLRQERTLRVIVPDGAAEPLRRARAVQDHYADLRLDLTDAVNVVLAERYETHAILTLDTRAFRALRPLTGHRAFRLLPDDL